ncbi:MAG: TonB-dependent receptor plug domain-containing protein [Pseudomonadota bacterium]
MIRPLFCAAAMAACMMAGSAQEAEDKTVFVLADFAQSAPQNARDMVERIPGFRLSDSRDQDESRGLGQATENVLINGQRVSSKSSSAADILSRIPAATVERIELLEGASLDIPGLSGLVVNVIAQPQGISGTWAYRARVISSQKPLYGGGEVSVSGQNGDVAWSVSADAVPRGGSGAGSEQIISADGRLLESSRILERGRFPGLGGQAGLRWTPSSGLVANINADWENFKRDRREIAERTLASGEFQRQRLERISEGTTAEISGDVEFDVAAGRLKVIGVYSDSDDPFTSSRNVRDASGVLLEDQFFRQVTDETELILRGEYNWSAFGGAWDASLESAANTLESEAILLSDLGTGTRTPVDIGDTRVDVEETRNEGFLTFSRALGDALQMQISLGAEVSELTSSGPQGQTRRFTRPKGGATLSWRAGEYTTLNARINREVGQLDFFDFVSQLDLDDGDDQIGNANIVPEQSWRGELELERRLGAWGATNILLFGEALEDIVDQVPIGTGEGPGNIESGVRLGVQLEGTLNFDPLGVKGAQLTYSAVFQDSQIDDPLTGERRAINGEEQVEIELELRHDIEGTNLAWGGEYTPEIRADEFRLDSVLSQSESPGRLSLFVEHKNIFGLTGRVEMFRPFENIDKNSRLRFAPDRTGALVEIERGRVLEERVLIFELLGKF